MAEVQFLDYEGVEIVIGTHPEGVLLIDLPGVMAGAVVLDRNQARELARHLLVYADTGDLDDSGWDELGGSNG